MHIRHINRGDIDEGGCRLCKPRHKRFDEELPPIFLIEEGLHDFYEEDEPIEKILADWDHGEKGLTGPPIPD